MMFHGFRDGSPFDASPVFQNKTREAKSVATSTRTSPQCGAPKIAELVNITAITRVYGSYNML